MVLIDIVVFIAILFFVFYLPGRFLLRLADKASSLSVTSAILSFAIGLSIYLTGMYTLSWINLSLLYYVFPLIIAFVEGRNTLREIKKTAVHIRNHSWETVLVVAGTICMSYIMWRSGTTDSQGNMLFYEVNSIDAIWHISLIGNLVNIFPPTHPGLDGIPLRGYNFFYDFLLAGIHRIYPIAINDLFFRYLPVIVSLLYGITLMMIGKFFSMKRNALLFFLFLGYFSQSVGIGMAMLFNLSYDSPIVQPMGNIVDPSVILSVILFFATFPLLFAKNRRLLFLAIPILAVLPMIKIYTAFLAFASLGLLSVYELYRRRSFQYLSVLFPSGIIAAFLYFPINFGAGSLVFSPFLIYRHYMESGAVIPEYQWILKYQVFEADNNYLRIALLYVLAIGLFFIPSLGVRLVSFLSIRKLFEKKFYTDKNIFLSLSILFSLLIPTFFIQSVAVFVTVQFIWIGYFLLLIPTAITLGGIVSKMKKISAILLVVVIVLLQIPETVRLLYHYSVEPLVVENDFVTIAHAVDTLVPKQDGLVVVNPVRLESDSGETLLLPITSALSSHSVYYEPEVLEFMHLDSIVNSRRARIETMHNLLKTCDDDVEYHLGEFLREIENSYILTAVEYPCLNTATNIRKISASGPYALYKLSQ